MKTNLGQKRAFPHANIKFATHATRVQHAECNAETWHKYAIRTEVEGPSAAYWELCRAQKINPRCTGAVRRRPRSPKSEVVLSSAPAGS